MFKKPLLLQRSLFICFSTAAITPLLLSSKAWSASVSTPLDSFSGTLNSVPLVYKDRPVETGPITIKLDPNATRTSTFEFDDKAGTASIDLNLLVDFPLLKTIGQPSPSIRIIENGTAFITNDQLTAALTGGGTIGSGSIFEGVSFSNSNSYRFGTRPGDRPGTIITGEWNTTGGSVTLPPSLGGGTRPTNGGGQTKPVPEPSTILGLGMTLVFGTLMKRQYAGKRKKTKQVG